MEPFVETLVGVEEISSDVEVSDGKLCNEEDILDNPTETILPEVTTFELVFRHYNNLWQQTQIELYNILRTDAPEKPPPVFVNRNVAVRRTSTLHLQYVTVCNKLVTCHDNLPHPQKRRFLRKMINACIGRVLELKQELVSLEQSDFQYPDQVLMHLKLSSPKEAEMKFSDYFKEPESDEERRNKDIVLSLLERKREEKMKAQAVTEQEKKVRMAMMFIQMIQAHERTRQARTAFAEIQRKYVKRELANRKEQHKLIQIRRSRDEYATVIQRAWRKFNLGKKIGIECAREMERLKMTLPSKYFELSDEIEKHKQAVISRNLKEYLKSKENLKEKMREFDVPRMRDTLEDKIRKFFKDYYGLYVSYPEFPVEEEGGSNALFFYTFPGEVKEKKGKKGDKKEKKEEKGKTDGKKGKEEDVSCTLKVSKFLPTIVHLTYEYRQIWMRRELKNYDRFDSELLEEEVTAELLEEIRLMVDEKMRNECSRLSEAHERAVKGGKKKGGKKGGKEKKEGKGKKEETDLTGNRTLESLVQELVDNGIIVDYPKVLLSDFVGGYNLSGSLKQLALDPELDPEPCLADIRRVVSEYCVLPMSSSDAHSEGCYIKSLLLAGPKGSGKKTLAYAVCTEIGATMMDLSASNLQGKYPDPEDLKMLSHLVLKVSRLLQPTVIFIGDAETYLWKKRPKSCTLAEPSRLKKELPKIVKKISDGDRVLLLGVSDLPFDAEPKATSGCYERILCVLKPDHDCRVALWKEFIARNGGVFTGDVSVLGNVSDGFTGGSMEAAVRQALTGRRLGWQRRIPLSASDFAFALAGCVPVYEEEQAEYRAWIQKMPMQKNRLDLALQRIELQEEDEYVSEPDDY